MRHEDYIAIEDHIRRAQAYRAVYIGEQLGSALAWSWKFGEDCYASLKAALQGAKAGMEEHRRRRTVAAAHAAH